MSIKVEYSFNQLFFDEFSRDQAYASNRDFWLAMDELQKQNPDAEFVLTIALMSNFGNYTQDVAISCKPKHLKPMADRIREKYWFWTPIYLYPEFQGRKDLDFRV